MKVVLAMVLAGLALPLSVSAQGTDEGWLEEFYPELLVVDVERIESAASLAP